MTADPGLHFARKLTPLGSLLEPGLHGLLLVRTGAWLPFTIVGCAVVRNGMRLISRQTGRNCASRKPRPDERAE